MWAGLVARARGPLPSDGERTCLSEGISPWAGRWAVLAELSCCVDSEQPPVRPNAGRGSYLLVGLRDRRHQFRTNDTDAM
jgi:hypothetical protein